MMNRNNSDLGEESSLALLQLLHSIHQADDFPHQKVSDPPESDTMDLSDCQTLYSDIVTDTADGQVVKSQRF